MLCSALRGQTEGTAVWLDPTAAGHGWFLDLTPQDNAEFHFVKGLSQWVADGHSPAFGQIDLLTVVMHELGHVLGFADQQATNLSTATLMTETLPDGVRWTLSGVDLGPQVESGKRQVIRTLHGWRLTIHV